MQLSLRPCVTVGVTVIAAGLIHVTPPAAPDIGQPTVALAAAWDVIDVVGPIDTAAGSLGGVVDVPVPSPAYVDTPSYLDPGFWQYWWTSLWTTNPIDSWFMLINALVEIPIIGPVFSVVGLLSFVLWFFGPHPAVADDLVTGLENPYDSATPDVSDPVLLTGAASALGDSPDIDDVLTAVVGVAAMSEPAAMLDDPSTIVDLAALISIVDPDATADLAAVLDPTEVVEPSVLPSLGGLPELDEVIPVLDISAGADADHVFDDGGIIDALVSALVF